MKQGTKEAGGGGPKQADGEQWEAVDPSEERQNLTEEPALWKQDQLQRVDIHGTCGMPLLHALSPLPLPLSWKKVCVTFDVFTDLRLQEGPQCGAVALVVAAGVMRQEGIIVDEVMDLVIENESERGGVTKKTENDLKVCTMKT